MESRRKYDLEKEARYRRLGSFITRNGSLFFVPEPHGVPEERPAISPTDEPQGEEMVMYGCEEEDARVSDGGREESAGMAATALVVAAVVKGAIACADVLRAG